MAKRDKTETELTGIHTDRRAHREIHKKIDSEKAIKREIERQR